MKLYEFLKVTQRDYDCYDTNYDACVTVCYIDEVRDKYDMGCINSEYDFTSEYDCCSKETLDRYLQAASDIEIKYHNNVVDSEWAYEAAGAIAEKLFAELDK